MSKVQILTLAATVLLILGGCRTLDKGAVHVTLVDKADERCSYIDHVSINYTWWGLTTEATAALRNKVAERGGNTLVLITDRTGAAYSCPDEVMRRSKVQPAS